MRVLLIVAALTAGAWLAVQARGAHAERQLTKLAFGNADPSDAQTLLRADRLLNPDRRPDLFDGVIAGRQGDFKAATAAFARVTAAEPENIEAWALLASAAQRTDPQLAERARATARRLAPPVQTR